MKPPPELLKKATQIVGQEPPKRTLRFRHNMFVRFVVSGMKKSEIINRMGISTGTYNAWLKKEEIVKLIEERVQSDLDLDAKKRKRRIEIVATELFDELTQKIADGSLEKLGVKNLMHYIVTMNKEIRLDTPGENIKKVDHRVNVHMIEQLSDRFKKSNSSTFENREKIIDIDIPKQLTDRKKEEIADGIIIPEKSKEPIEARKERRFDSEGRSKDELHDRFAPEPSRSRALGDERDRDIRKSKKENKV